MLSAHALANYINCNDELRETLGINDCFEGEPELLARGEYNQNYLFKHPITGQKLVFRVNLGSQLHLDEQISYEAHALTLLESSRRTPRLIYVDDSKEYFAQGILIEEWLPGRPLVYETDMEQAACILADIHATPLPDDHNLIAPENPPLDMVKECETMFAQYRAWSDANLEVITRVNTWFELCRTFTQSDPGEFTRHIISTELNSHNFLINTREQNDGVSTNTPANSENPIVTGEEQCTNSAISYLVDWEKPLAAQMEQDLAHFLAPTTTNWKTDTILSKAEREEFICLYEQAVVGRFSTSGLRDRLDDYLALTCLRGITWSAMALAQHETGQRAVADEYTLQRIQDFLALEYLENLQDEFFA